MPDPVSAACIACYEAEKGDCSGFVHAVGAALGVQIEGMADDIVNALRAGGKWQKLPDGPAAAASAAAGNLVVAGLRGDEQAVPNVHGHVVVVVAGALNRGIYPTAYWGSLGGSPGYDQTINWAWTEADRDRVSYAAQVIP